MRKILAKVDESRLGRAVAGLVRRELIVEDVVRDGGEIRAAVRSIGKRGVKVYSVEFHVAGKGARGVLQLRRSQEAQRVLQAHRGSGPA